MLKKIIDGLLNIVGMILAIFAILFLIFMVIIIYYGSYKISPLTTVSTEDGQYVIEVQNAGDPSLLYRESRGRFVLKHENKTTLKYKFTVENQGNPFRESNFTYKWEDDRVTIIVTGLPYYTETYTLYFDGDVDWVTEDGNRIDQDKFDRLQVKPTPSPTPVEEPIYDAEGVLLDEDNQLLKREIIAIFDYLISEGVLSEVPETFKENRELSFFYSAKGGLKAKVYSETLNLDKSNVFMNQTLVFNQSTDNIDEFVHYENYTDEHGNEVKNSKIISFVYINRSSFELKVDEQSDW